MLIPRVIGALPPDHDYHHYNYMLQGSMRLTVWYNAILRLVHPNKDDERIDDEAGEAAAQILEAALAPAADLRFTAPTGELLVDVRSMFSSYGGNGLVLGVYIGDDPEDEFLRLFDLPDSDRLTYPEDNLGFIVVFLTPQPAGVGLTAVAILATEEDAWPGDATDVPDSMRDKLIAKAKEALNESE